MASIWSNQTLWVPIVAALSVQVYKFIYESIRARSLAFSTLGRAGGMPSSHSAMVCGLATAVGHRYGWDSGDFAIATVLAIIVMYDASGVRQAAGKQARVINQMVRELFGGKPLSEVRLIELLGHTQLEVLVGAIVGVLFALFTVNWFEAV